MVFEEDGDENWVEWHLRDGWKYMQETDKRISQYCIEFAIIPVPQHKETGFTKKGPGNSGKLQLV